MSRQSNIASSTLVLVLSVAFGAPARSANVCDVLYTAGIKSVQTPHHVYSTATMKGGKAQTGEAIYAGGVEYLQLDGKWMRSPMTHQEMLAAAQGKLKAHQDTCTTAGDQTVNGQVVSVYKTHNNELGTNQMVHILKSNGLIQGGRLALPDGSVIETRYEYDNVQAPAGVN